MARRKKSGGGIKLFPIIIALLVLGGVGKLMGGDEKAEDTRSIPSAVVEEVTEAEAPTEAETEPPTEETTEPETEAATEENTEAPTEPPTEPETEAQPEPETEREIIVYLPENGEKYHYEDCWTLKGNGRPVTLEEAKRLGYEPCGVCNPPIE